MVHISIAAKPSLFKVLNVGSVRQLDHAVSLLNSCRILQVQTRGGDAEFYSAHILVRGCRKLRDSRLLFCLFSRQNRRRLLESITNLRVAS